MLPPDAVVQTVYPGVQSFKIWRPAGPEALYGVVWDRTRPDLALRVTHARNQVNTLEGTSAQAARLTTPTREVLAAVNGDFYIMSGAGRGATIGLCVRDGELLGLGNARPAFAVLAGGGLRIAPYQTPVTLTPPGGAALAVTRVDNSRGPDCLTLYTPAWGPSTKTDAGGVEVVLRWTERGVRTLTPLLDTVVEVTGAPQVHRGNAPLAPGTLVLSGQGASEAALAALRPGVQLRLRASCTPAGEVLQAVGGSAVLVAGGERVYQAKPGEPRHPRTAVGFDEAQGLLLVVDGRQSGYSAGVTLPELADLLREFGCRDGLNLDGGGSSTCWVRGSILNRPSDGGERAVANALALVAEGAAGPPSRLIFDQPDNLRLAPGAVLTVKATLADDRLNPLPGATPALAVEGDIGALAGATFTAGSRPGSGRLVARDGQLGGGLRVTIVERIARLEARPARLELAPGASATIEVTGYDASGQPVRLDARRLTWTLPSAVGQVDGSTVTAGPEGARGELRIEGYGAAVLVPFAVPAARLVEDFGQPAAVSFAGAPASVRGSVVVRDRVARLTFALGAEPPTRAAYLKCEHPLTRPLRLRASVRGDGQPVWLRAALVDGNGERHLLTLHHGPLTGAWTTATCEVPAGLKAPVVWQSVYVVATDAAAPTTGWVECRSLEVLEAR